MPVPCGNCKLCGKYGAKLPMVVATNEIVTSQGYQIKLKQTLNCKNYGIYMLQCKKCLTDDGKNIGTYIGQTTTKFSQRFSGHRQNWLAQFNNSSKIEQDDKYALFKHFKIKHQKLPAILEEAYNLVFLEQPNPENLNHREDYWKHKVTANINITRMTTANIH